MSSSGSNAPSKEAKQEPSLEPSRVQSSFIYEISDYAPGAKEDQFEAADQNPKSLSVKKPYVEIYTDGACANNPGAGGWGALLIFNGTRKEIFGHKLETTNNQMEIAAALYALQHLKRSCNVKLYTDSVYLQKGATEWMKNWQKNGWCKKDNKPVTNVELWKNLQHEIEKHDIIWCWVKGHAGNEGNNIADRLACMGKETAIKILKNAGSK